MLANKFRITATNLAPGNKEIRWHPAGKPVCPILKSAVKSGAGFVFNRCKFSDVYSSGEPESKPLTPLVEGLGNNTTPEGSGTSGLFRKRPQTPAPEGIKSDCGIRF